MRKILIVVADYYKDVSSALLKSAKSNITNKYSIKVIKVPGVFEIPVVISVDSKKPIGNGIITCLNMQQAKARGEKGKEAAKAVISVLSI